MKNRVYLITCVNVSLAATGKFCLRRGVLSCSGTDWSLGCCRALFQRTSDSDDDDESGDDDDEDQDDDENDGVQNRKKNTLISTSKWCFAAQKETVTHRGW